MCFGTSLEETCLLTKRQPVQRRHDLDTGVNTEQENLSIDDKGKDKRNPVHVRFRNHVKRIHAMLEIEKINTIRKVAQGGYELTETRIRFNKTGRIAVMKTVKTTGPCWQAAAWFLERRFPEDYGKKKPSVDDVTPGERAVQIKAAFDALMESVPTVPPE